MKLILNTLMVVSMFSGSAWASTPLLHPSQLPGKKVNCKAVNTQTGAQAAVQVQWGEIVETGPGHLPPYSVNQKQEAIVKISTPEFKAQSKVTFDLFGYTTRCYWANGHKAQIGNLAKIEFEWKTQHSCHFDLTNTALLTLFPGTTAETNYDLKCN